MAIDFTIENVLSMIKDHTLLELKSTDKVVKKLRGKKYFTIEIPQRVSESREYDILLRFANKYNQIEVVPNGFKSLAIIQK